MSSSCKAVIVFMVLTLACGLLAYVAGQQPAQAQTAKNPEFVITCSLEGDEIFPGLRCPAPGAPRFTYIEVVNAADPQDPGGCTDTGKTGAICPQ